MSSRLSSISVSSLVGGFIDFSLGSIFLSSCEVKSQSGFSVFLSSLINFFLFMLHNLDGCVDGIGGLELLFFHLIDVVLDRDVSVGNFNEVRS